MLSINTITNINPLAAGYILEVLFYFSIFHKYKAVDESKILCAGSEWDLLTLQLMINFRVFKLYLALRASNKYFEQPEAAHDLLSFSP